MGHVCGSVDCTYRRHVEEGRVADWHGRPYRFGDILAIDPKQGRFHGLGVDQRWMLLTIAAMGRPWTALRLWDGKSIVLTSLTGMMRVDE